MTIAHRINKSIKKTPKRCCFTSPLRSCWAPSGKKIIINNWRIAHRRDENIRHRRTRVHSPRIYAKEKNERGCIAGAKEKRHQQQRRAGGGGEIITFSWRIKPECHFNRTVISISILIEVKTKCVCVCKISRTTIKRIYIQE